jgi:hypothetical protein
MSLIRSILFQAGRRLAADPRVREKAKRAWETEIGPRVTATGADLRRMAAEPGARDDPARLAGRATRRVWEEITGKRKK